MDLLALFAVLLKDSALTLGGLGSLPLLRQDLVATGIATDPQLVEALAIGREARSEVIQRARRIEVERTEHLPVRVDGDLLRVRASLR